MILILLITLAVLLWAIQAETELRDREIVQVVGACPQCTALVELNWLVCPHCRTRLSDSCKRCQHSKMINYRHCPHCGHDGGEQS
ncbi:MAG: hypothetical protein C0618_00885 [Desulfuromonas sp.]|nr:MAG: hypothetical protein C0618_00885 [Desulfuromonas sp.]